MRIINVKIIIIFLMISIAPALSQLYSETYVYSNIRWCNGTCVVLPSIAGGGGRIICPENMMWDHRQGKCVPIVIVTPSTIQAYLGFFNWDKINRKVSITNIWDKTIEIELNPTVDWIWIDPQNIVLEPGQTKEAMITISQPEEVFGYIEILRNNKKVTDIKIEGKKIDIAGFEFLKDFLKETKIPIIVITAAEIVYLQVPLFWIIMVILAIIGIYEWKRNKRISLICFLLIPLIYVICTYM